MSNLTEQQAKHLVKIYQNLMDMASRLNPETSYGRGMITGYQSAADHVKFMIDLHFDVQIHELIVEDVEFQEV